MSDDFATHYLEDALLEFRRLKELADRAIAQVSDDELFAAPDEELNSIAIIMKHMAGNMRSRWTDFLNADGEKPDRDRDGEFVIAPGTARAEIIERWEAGWKRLFGALEPLAAKDLERTVLIQGEPHSVTQAMQRQLTHYAYHVGQIVLLAKDFRSSDWKSLSIPRGKSKDFNDAMVREQEGRREQERRRMQAGRGDPG